MHHPWIRRFFLVFLLFLSLPLFPQNRLFTDDSDIITDIKFMQSLLPVLEGSENEKIALRFIETRLSLLKVSYTEKDFSKSTNSHSFSRIIDVLIPGEREETVVICIPLNSQSGSSGEILDHSISIALGLAVIAEYQLNPPPVSVRVLFLGAERGNDSSYPIGTRFFLDTFYPESPHVFLYLDIAGIPREIRVQTGSRELVSPLWMLTRMSQSFRDSKFPFQVSNTDTQVYRTGLSSRETSIAPILQAGYAALGLSQEGKESSQLAEPEKIHALKQVLINFIISFYAGFPEEWDYHFLFFHNPFFDLVVPETEYVIILLFGCVLFIVLAFLRFREIRKYWDTLRKNILSIPVFFLFAFYLLLASSFILDGVLLIRDIPTLWMFHPVAFLLLKISLFLFFSTILFKFLKKLPFPRNGSFFSAASIFFTILSLLTITIINISFAYYFLWSLFCIVLFSMAKKPWLKIVFFFLAPLSLASIIADIFLAPYSSLCNIILFDKLSGNFLFAIIILPYALLLIRIRMLFRYTAAAFYKRRSFIFMVGALAILVSIGVFLFFFSPYSSEHPAEVKAVRTIDFDKKTNELAFDSPVPIPGIRIVEPDISGTIVLGKRSHSFYIPTVKDYLTTRLYTKAFLNRKTMTVSLGITGHISSIKAELSSDTPFELHDCNFPFQRIENGNSYRIFIGKTPPSELDCELTLPPGKSYSLSIVLTYEDPPDNLDVSIADSTLNYSLVFKKTISFIL